MFGFDDDGKALPADRTFEYRVGKHYEIDQGRVFAANKFEAVIGSDVTRMTGLKLGDEFQATHGMPQPNETPDIHKPRWKVVGVLKQTHTAADGVLYIPLTSFYCIAEHDVGLVAQNAIREGKSAATAVETLKKQDEAAKKEKPNEEEVEHYTVAPDGTIQLQLPKDVWGLSAILVRSRGGFNASNLIYSINNGRDAAAVNPATVMREFFQNFLSGSTIVLLLISLMVTIVAAVGILVSIYNSVSARSREIAILRALGATRGKVLMLICIEATLIGVVGAVVGLLAGHLLAAGGSFYLERLLGEGINWVAWDRYELLYLLLVAVIALIAGLVPALKAYRVPVATNLVAG
jgi:putative ABC transport system permease protein